MGSDEALKPGSFKTKSFWACNSDPQVQAWPPPRAQLMSAQNAPGLTKPGFLKGLDWASQCLAQAALGLTLASGLYSFVLA